MKPLLLIKTGDAIAEVIAAHGDFEDWFARGLGCKTLLQVDIHKGQKLPDPSKVSAVVITGSAAMVSHREDWSEEAARWLLIAMDASLPILGVCYGHQLLAHALGGEVGPNPQGREMGTCTMVMESGSEGDRLFGDYPRKFNAQTSHLETVLQPPESAIRLGSSALDKNAILRFSETAWGVQYHPEFSMQIMREYIRIRSSFLLEEGLDPAELLACVAETPMAASILPAFARIRSEAKAA